MRAVIYLRVSDPKQEASGLGLEAQEAACRAWAAREGCEVTGVWQDVLSGPTAPADRPGLTAALAALPEGGVLVVAKRDRMSRDPYHMMSVERTLASMGSRLVSAAGEASDDDSPTGILLRRILDAFAEHERLLIKVRTRVAMRAKAARGEYTGGRVPVGCVVVGERVLDHAGKPMARPVVDTGAVASARRYRVQAGMSLRATAAALAQDGFLAPSGRAYSASSVARMVED